MAVSEPSLFARIGLAFACFFRVLLDARFARSVQQIGQEPALPAGAEEGSSQRVAKDKRPDEVSGTKPGEGKSSEKKQRKTEGSSPLEQEAAPAVDVAAEQVAGALVLLGVLQRQGRLIDFLEQDIDAFDDEDVGAAARQVHEGCRQALRGHAQVQALHEQEEDSRVTVEAGYDAAAYKLSGKVGGAGPYEGKLVHRGWRVKELSLPQLMADADATVVAPAEVEVS